MLLAVSVMSAEVRMILFGISVVLFVLASLGYERGKLGFVGLGLAFFAFPFFWDALAAS